MTDQSGIKGYDGEKKINGRKRLLMVDVLGLLILVNVTAASTGDRAGGLDLVAKNHGSVSKNEVNLGGRQLYRIFCRSALEAVFLDRRNYSTSKGQGAWISCKALVLDR